MKKGKKIICATLAGTIMFGAISPVQVFAMTSSMRNSLNIEVSNNSRTNLFAGVENGVNFELLERAFIEEFKNQDTSSLVQERGVASTAVKTAVKWIKKNATKIANVLKKYVAFKGGAEFIINICDAVAGVSATIDELVYNIVDAMFPGWSDNTVARVADIIRVLMPF